MVKCQNREETEKLQKEAEKVLDANYEVHITKLRKPRIKIINCDTDMSEKQIEEDIRDQNQFIKENDKLIVTYIKKHKNSEFKTVYAECSPELFQKFMYEKKVYLQWERYRVYEDISIPRCFKCQEYYHKNNECNKKTVCEHCMGEHNIAECPKTTKKCVNCVVANQKFKTNHDVSHKASDLECPTYKYLIEVMRSKIDYGL